MQQAAASVIATVSRGGNTLKLVVKRWLELFYRLIGGRGRIWPPSRESGPLLAAVWLALLSPLPFLLRQRRGRDIALVEERRREHALSSISNILANEDLRLASSPIKPPPPLAEKLFALLYDEIDQHDITILGVPRTDPRFLRGMELLRSRTSSELREAIDKTRQARNAAHIDDVPEEGRRFADGRAMRRLVRFVKNQILVYMRADGDATCSDTFDHAECAKLQQLVEEADSLSSKMLTENRRAMTIIWKLYQPCRCPMVVGTLLIFLSETAAASIVVSSLQLPYIANMPGTRAQVMAHAYLRCLSHFVLWAFHQQASMIGNMLVSHAKANFTMRLRNSTMRAILSQDCECVAMFVAAGSFSRFIRRVCGTLSFAVERAFEQVPRYSHSRGAAGAASASVWCHSRVFGGETKDCASESIQDFRSASVHAYDQSAAFHS